MDDWTTVYLTESSYLAEAARQMLSDNGIEAVIMNKKDSAYPMIGHIEVMVNKGDQAEAEKLLKEFSS
jgi:hypothetical protein